VSKLKEKLKGFSHGIPCRAHTAGKMFLITKMKLDTVRLSRVYWTDILTKPITTRLMTQTTLSS
jgi:hypothetical protein